MDYKKYTFEQLKQAVENTNEINLLDTNGATLLEVIVKQGHPDLAKRAIENGADCTVITDHNFLQAPLLCLSAELGDIGVFEALLDEFDGYDLDEVRDSPLGDPLLVYAVRSGSLEIIKKVIDKGAVVNCASNYGHTALLEATLVGNGDLVGDEDIIDYLLSNGADPECADEAGYSFYWHIAGSPHWEKYRNIISDFSLLERIDDEGETVFYNAVRKNNLPFLKFAAEKDVNIAHSVDRKPSLHQEARNCGNQEILDFLSQYPEPAKPQDLDKKLYNAVVSSDANKVDEYLKMGANPLAELSDVGNIIQDAFNYGRPKEVISAFINNKCIDKMSDDARKGLVGPCVTYGFSEALNALFKSGLDLSSPPFSDLAALTAAAQDNNKKIVDALVNNGASTTPLYGKQSPLCSAMNYGHWEMAHYLIEKGCDPIEHNTATSGKVVEFALKESSNKLLGLMCFNGLDLNQRHEKTLVGGQWPLLHHLIMDHPERISEIIERGATDLSIQDKRFKYTAFCRAVERNNETAIQSMWNLDWPFTPNKEGKTPLYYSIRSKNTELAEEMIKRGADVNCIDIDGRTILFEFLNTEHLEQAKLLINNGLDLTVKDDKGLTCLDYAILKGEYEEIAEICGDVPPSQAILDIVNSVSNKVIEPLNDENRPHYESFLHFSCYRSDVEGVKTLLDADCNPNCLGESVTVFPDAHWQGGTYTPMHWAALRGSEEIVELLFEHGADPMPPNIYSTFPAYLAKDNGFEELYIKLEKLNKLKKKKSKKTK